jgi:hypothetical protein
MSKTELGAVYMHNFVYNFAQRGEGPNFFGKKWVFGWGWFGFVCDVRGGYIPCEAG